MSRRDQIRMTEDALHEFVSSAHTIIVNSIGKDGVPHPMPMWFGVEDDGAIVMSTFTKSQKIKNLERDPRVSLLVEDGEEYSKLRGVVIYGKAELIRDDDAVVEILVRVNSKTLSGEVDAEELRTALRKTAPKRTGIRIRPDRIVSWDHTKLGGTY
ncbi:MAG: PPOX class F420-dependent oxidoreductase [bacterium]|nr:PPOX class F420-dependent oxidoreductase [bacterium]MCP5065395.1 PPOX class F420-dependent oxidoreductase [bacterium]